MLATNLILALSTLISLTSAASPTSFCKCTCFTNSTIIPLDAPISTSPRIAHDVLFLPRDTDDPDDTQDRLPDDPPVEEVPPEKLPEGEGGKGKGKGKEKEEDEDRKEYRAGNCNDCNRQFCLDYNLPICKGAGMEDVFTTCFRECAPAVLWNDGVVQDHLWASTGSALRTFVADVEGTERDSRKDEAVVFIFIFATAGLLIWAAIKPWVGKWVDSARERRSYIPVSTQGDG